jgi:UDP-N-acetylglucosamine diphosphorylase/glucosamine-1-phosphate N-acetyltransferase
MPAAPGLVCYDDAIARGFEPFALTRPWSEMRVGALLVRERWEVASGLPARALLAGSAMQHFREPGAPRAARGVLPAGTLIAHARCAVALCQLPADAPLYRCAGADGRDRVAAVRLARDEPADTFADGTLTLEALARRHHGRRTGVRVAGTWCDHVWDVIGSLGERLADDLPRLARRHGCAPLGERGVDDGGVVVGAHPVWLEPGAVVEPLCVFDTTQGPVLLRRGASVHAFSRVTGPCYVGEGTMISGGRVGGSALGDRCKVHGEVSASVFVGHANKGHDGFVGHSVLGRWVNLGAGTTTSNLKNTYGPVALWTPTGVRDTGLQFLGTLFGDHAKTGIGLRLTTGCVIGAGANVVDRMPPKAVPPFAWGSGAPYATWEGEKFLATAARVMARRHVTLDAAGARHLRTAFTRRWRLD